MALPLRADALWMPACAGMTIVERDWNERTVARGAGRIGNCWRGRGEDDRGEPHAGGAAGGPTNPGRSGVRAGRAPRSGNGNEEVGMGVRGRKRVVEGKSVAVRVDLGVSRLNTKQK